VRCSPVTLAASFLTPPVTSLGGFGGRHVLDLVSYPLWPLVVRGFHRPPFGPLVLSALFPRFVSRFRMSVLLLVPVHIVFCSVGFFVVSVPSFHAQFFA